ncbi:hypothetical protein Tco_0564966 [Tanacetum coccineum]
MSMEALQAREDLMISIETFLKKFNRISFKETPKVLMQAWKKVFEIKHAKSEEVQELLSKLVQDLQSINEELAEYINLPSWNWPTPSYNDDDDEYSFATQEYFMTCSTAITPVLSPEEPVDSQIMEDEHLDTIPETESDEFIKSSVENLVPTPSESEDFSDIESECDVPVCDNFTNFSNPLFDANDDDTSSDVEEFKISSNPLFDLDEVSPIDEEVLENTNSIPSGIEISCFNSASDLLESFLNRDSSIDSSQKIDFLLDEFAEGDILFLESLFHDNSSPRPPKAFSANSDTSIESLPTFPIPVEDSDYLREEIDISPGPADSIPLGIENDDFDSEDDDNSTFLPEFESFHVDYPDSGDSTMDVVEDILVDMPNILPTHPVIHLDFDFIPSNDLGSNLDVFSPSGHSNKIYDPGIYIDIKSMRILATLSPLIDNLLPFSYENVDKVFNHGVLSYKEKSSSSSHRGLKASKLFHHQSPMLIHGDNTPNLGVRHPYFYPP